MKTEYGWPPASWRMLYGVVMVYLVCLGLFACGEKMPGSNSTTTNAVNTTNIFINNNVNTPGDGADGGYIKMAVTQQDNLNFLVEWETLGVFATAAPYLTYDFYLNGKVVKKTLTGGMYIWAAENADGSYILKVCIADMSGAFCSNEALVEITAVEEVAGESG